MASRKEGVISGDQEDKRRRLKSLKRRPWLQKSKEQLKNKYQVMCRMDSAWQAGRCCLSQWGVMLPDEWLEVVSGWFLRLCTLHPHEACTILPELSIPGIISFFYCACVLVTQSCLTLCDTMHCSPPGCSVHGVFQARVLEWVASAFSLMQGM